jgi:hypothetical protein
MRFDAKNGFRVLGLMLILPALGLLGALLYIWSPWALFAMFAVLFFLAGAFMPDNR